MQQTQTLLERTAHALLKSPPSTETCIRMFTQANLETRRAMQKIVAALYSQCFTITSAEYIGAASVMEYTESNGRLQIESLALNLDTVESVRLHSPHGVSIRTGSGGLYTIKYAKTQSGPEDVEGETLARYLFIILTFRISGVYPTFGVQNA